MPIMSLSLTTSLLLLTTVFSGILGAKGMYAFDYYDAFHFDAFRRTDRRFVRASSLDADVTSSGEVSSIQASGGRRGMSSSNISDSRGTSYSPTASTTTPSPASSSGISRSTTDDETLYSRSSTPDRDTPFSRSGLPTDEDGEEGLQGLASKGVEGGVNGSHGLHTGILGGGKNKNLNQAIREKRRQMVLERLNECEETHCQICFEKFDSEFSGNLLGVVKGEDGELGVRFGEEVGDDVGGENRKRSAQDGNEELDDEMLTSFESLFAEKKCSEDVKQNADSNSSNDPKERKHDFLLTKHQALLLLAAAKILIKKQQGPGSQQPLGVKNWLNELCLELPRPEKWRENRRGHLVGSSSDGTQAGQGKQEEDGTISSSSKSPNRESQSGASSSSSPSSTSSSSTSSSPPSPSDRKENVCFNNLLLNCGHDAQYCRPCLARHLVQQAETRYTDEEGNEIKFDADKAVCPYCRTKGNAGVAMDVWDKFRHDVLAHNEKQVQMYQKPCWKGCPCWRGILPDNHRFSRGDRNNHEGDHSRPRPNDCVYDCFLGCSLGLGECLDAGCRRVCSRIGLSWLPEALEVWVEERLNRNIDEEANIGTSSSGDSGSSSSSGSTSWRRAGDSVSGGSSSSVVGSSGRFLESSAILFHRGSSLSEQEQRTIIPKRFPSKNPFLVSRSFKDVRYSHLSPAFHDLIKSQIHPIAVNIPPNVFWTSLGGNNRNPSTPGRNNHRDKPTNTVDKTIEQMNMLNKCSLVSVLQSAFRAARCTLRSDVLCPGREEGLRMRNSLNDAVNGSLIDDFVDGLRDGARDWGGSGGAGEGGRVDEVDGDRDGSDRGDSGSNGSGMNGSRNNHENRSRAPRWLRWFRASRSSSSLLHHHHLVHERELLGRARASPASASGPGILQSQYQYHDEARVSERWAPFCFNIISWRMMAEALRSHSFGFGASTYNSVERDEIRRDQGERTRSDEISDRLLGQSQRNHADGDRGVSLDEPLLGRLSSAGRLLALAERSRRMHHHQANQHNQVSSLASRRTGARVSVRRHINLLAPRLTRVRAYAEDPIRETRAGGQEMYGNGCFGVLGCFRGLSFPRLPAWMGESPDEPFLHEY